MLRTHPARRHAPSGSGLASAVRSPSDGRVAPARVRVPRRTERAAVRRPHQPRSCSCSLVLRCDSRTSRAAGSAGAAPGSVTGTISPAGCCAPSIGMGGGVLRAGPPMCSSTRFPFRRGTRPRNGRPARCPHPRASLRCSLSSPYASTPSSSRMAPEGRPVWHRAEPQRATVTRLSSRRTRRAGGIRVPCNRLAMAAPGGRAGSAARRGWVSRVAVPRDQPLASGSDRPRRRSRRLRLAKRRMSSRSWRISPLRAA